MTEHVHEWKIRGAGFRCKDFPKCPVQLSNEEVEARLNATERLSAEDARLWADRIEQYFRGAQIVDAFRAYADILEGKDENE